MSEQQVCKCCGQTLPDLSLPDGLKLSGKRKLLFTAVNRAGQHGITTSRLFDALYGDDPNGGPNTGTRIISTQVFFVNKRLKDMGWRIKGGHTGHGVETVYKLVKP